MTQANLPEKLEDQLRLARRYTTPLVRRCRDMEPSVSQFLRARAVGFFRAALAEREGAE